jgi:hypothetical protein
MKSDKISVVIVATTLLTVASTVATQILISVFQQEALAQNSSIANQTIPSMGNQTMTNQTQGVGGNYSCNGQPDTGGFRISSR